MLLSLLALACPPLAVLLAGRRSQAAANVLLTLFLYVPGVVHALCVVDRHHTDQRNAALLRAMARYGG
jgi:uncharacterized membrane protein YqaE (UPF0057 family)